MNQTGPAPAQTLASNRQARWLLASLLTISLVMAGITKGTYDSGDSLKHYMFARYAFQHPLNYLDSWAKPLFTLLASGPAQGGFLGMKLFQCAVVALSAWCAYVVARALRLPMPELAVLFAYAAPDYFIIQFSGLTEPLFGLVLVGAVALAMTGRPYWSAALISWLPFVRSEGFILLGIWVVYLGWRRQWRALPLLGLGYVVFSVGGGLILGDFGWVFRRNPYSTISVYGHGEWSHFFMHLPGLLGWVLTALALVGGGRILRDCTRPEHRARPLFRAELLLIYGSITVFVLAHTIFWTAGLFNSFGITRVLDVTAPLFAVVALNGLAGLMALGHSAAAKRRIRIGVTVAVVAFVFTGARNAFRWRRDFMRPPDQLVVDDAARWIRQMFGAGTRPLAYEIPYLAEVLDNDPFNPATHPTAPGGWAPQPDTMPVGTLLVWDDWFVRTESQLPLAQMQADPRFLQRWSGALPRNPSHPEHDTTRIIIFERVR